MVLKEKYMLLKNRIPIIMIIGMLLIAISIITISFSKYENLNVSKHVTMAEGMTQLMADAFDVTALEDYIDKNYSSDKYNQVLRYYYSLKKKGILLY